MKSEDLVEDWEREQEEQRESVDLRRRGQLADLRFLVSTEAGRRVVLRILNTSGLFRQSYTGNANTYFKEGQRSIGLWLFSELLAASESADPMAWLVKESGLWAAKEREAEDARRR
jgi:hypothetical protein